MPPPRVEVPEPEPEPEVLPPPRVQPLLLPEELGGIVFGQGRSRVGLQPFPPIVSNAEAVAGSIVTRTAATRATPITFFMTFLLF
jgi:hypothetical protein